MKEATGELNSTVIVLITIGLLSTFFFTIVWPFLNKNLKSSTKCSSAYCPPVCTKSNNGKKTCKPNWADDDHKTVKCKYEGTTMKCPYKG